jgi:hypothetical protein
MPLQLESEYPDLSALKSILTPERLTQIARDPQRVQFVKEYSAKLAADPVFLKSIEAMFKSHAHQEESKRLIREIESHGWTSASPIHPDLPSPTQQAAAVATAVAAMVAPPVPV